MRYSKGHGPITQGNWFLQTKSSLCSDQKHKRVKFRFKRTEGLLTTRIKWPCALHRLHVCRKTCSSSFLSPVGSWWHIWGACLWDTLKSVASDQGIQTVSNLPRTPFCKAEQSLGLRCMHTLPWLKAGPASTCSSSNSYCSLCFQRQRQLCWKKQFLH